MRNGALLVRAMECARRLERQPHAEWLQLRFREAADELLLRRTVGTLSDALCGIWDHHLSAAGGITPCSCTDE